MCVDLYKLDIYTPSKNFKIMLIIHCRNTELHYGYYP